MMTDLYTELMEAGEPLESKRRRHLRTPAQEEYERRETKFTTELRNIKDDMDAGAAHADQIKDDPSSLKSVRDLIQSCEKAYKELSLKFIEYLRTVRSYESDNEESSHNLICKTVLCKASMVSNRIDSLLNPPPPSVSQSRYSHRNSVKSNVSYLERKEAELRAAVVKKKFLEEEANIIRQRADLETKLKAIKIEEEIETKRLKSLL